MNGVALEVEGDGIAIDDIKGIVFGADGFIGGTVYQVRGQRPDKVDVTLCNIDSHLFGGYGGQTGEGVRICLNTQGVDATLRGKDIGHRQGVALYQHITAFAQPLILVGNFSRVVHALGG